jgi:hypothetical protein
MIQASFRWPLAQPSQEGESSGCMERANQSIYKFHMPPILSLTANGFFTAKPCLRPDQRSNGCDYISSLPEQFLGFPMDSALKLCFSFILCIRWSDGRSLYSWSDGCSIVSSMTGPAEAYLTGHWNNTLGSQVDVVANNGRLSGTYYTAVSSGEKIGGTELTGTYRDTTDGVLIALTVQWALVRTVKRDYRKQRGTEKHSMMRQSSV